MLADLASLPPTYIVTKQPRPSPFTWLTEHPDDVQGFSNAATKVKLEPTLEFWSSIRLYTTFSAYPIIDVFVERILSYFTDFSPKDLLLAPCGAGDFVRLWPSSRTPLTSITGVDIRPDFLEIAKIRLAHPALDQLNLRLCWLLDEVHLSRRNKAADAVDKLSSIFALTEDMHGPGWINPLANDGDAKLLARAFDQILGNQAVPDWYYPSKVLLGAAGCRESLKVAKLGEWVCRHPNWVAKLALEAESLQRLAEPPENQLFKNADLTRPGAIPHRSFDLVISWEFIHIVRDARTMRVYLHNLIYHLRPGGWLVITSIRQPREHRDAPHEQDLAHRILDSRNDIRIHVCDNLAFGELKMPFYNRLDFLYPVLIAQKITPSEPATNA